jgi:hypothetical protein
VSFTFFVTKYHSENSPFHIQIVLS